MTNQQTFRNNTTVAQLVKNTTSEFVCYRDGDLWYRVISEPIQGIVVGGFVPQQHVGRAVLFEFPVPISDTGSGIFEHSHKSITLMRWIRKHYDSEKKLWAS